MSGQKNILLLTSLYPSDDVKIINNTSVCHYFAKEWIKMGYNVRVISLYNEYPIFFYPFMKMAKSVFADKFDAAILCQRKNSEYSYTLDGIKITRLPAYKNRPRGDFSEKIITKIKDRIVKILDEENFHPDYILGHFILPSIRIVSALKLYYPNAITAVSLHGKEQKKKDTINRNLSNIDYVGYRSYPIKDSFEKIYGKRPYFMCLSGVPANYITERQRSFQGGVHNFLFVGNMMKRKYPEVLVPAISQVYENKDFSITYVGDGNGIKKIKRQILNFAITDNVRFLGRINRDEVTKQMDAADIFIMISEKETFGLVYLEAMARGCITIASRNEGMEGIIKNRENGFLCKAGDAWELKRIIEEIKSMKPQELQIISKRAVETARNMTDVKMAEAYISSIIKSSLVQLDDDID